MALSRRAFMALLAGTGLLAPEALAAPPRGTFALAGTVYPGRGEPLHGHAVLVRQGRIEDVVPSESVTDRPVVAPENGSVLPGVINAHCHNLHTARERRERWLDHGVTAIGDAASPLRFLPALQDSPPGQTGLGLGLRAHALPAGRLPPARAQPGARPGRGLAHTGRGRGQTVGRPGRDAHQDRL